MLRLPPQCQISVSTYLGSQKQQPPITLIHRTLDGEHLWLAGHVVDFPYWDGRCTPCTPWQDSLGALCVELIHTPRMWDSLYISSVLDLFSFICTSLLFYGDWNMLIASLGGKFDRRVYLNNHIENTTSWRKVQHNLPALLHLPQHVAQTDSCAP